MLLSRLEIRSPRLFLVVLLAVPRPAGRVRRSPRPFPAWIQFGTSGSKYGWEVAGVGDVNQDGYDDVVVGANMYSNGHVDEGGAWLYLGSAAGPDTAADWHAEGNQTNAQMGYGVAGAGDVNSDGFDDVIVSAPAANRTHVYYGFSGGIPATPSWTATGCCSFGSSVSGAGDVNGDGFDDVIIGAMHGATASRSKVSPTSTSARQAGLGRTPCGPVRAIAPRLASGFRSRAPGT